MEDSLGNNGALGRWDRCNEFLEQHDCQGQTNRETRKVKVYGNEIQKGFRRTQGAASNGQTE